MTPPVGSSKPLTTQQLRFVDAYCQCWNGALAARTAGYAAARAKQTARDLLLDERIRAAIKIRAEELAMSADEAISRMSAWARVSIEDVMSREVVEHTPREQRPLKELVEELRQQLDFEQQVAIATEALLEDNERAKYRKQQRQLRQQRKVQLVRFELELVQDPGATKWVDGKTVAREVVQLDLMKVLDAQVGGLIKKLTPTKYGMAVELHDAKDATDKILKLHGAYAPQKVDFTNLSDEKLNELLNMFSTNLK